MPNLPKVCIVGGAGHVGAPLAVLLASKGFPTLIYDKNQQNLDQLRSGHFPFMEEGGDDSLREVLPTGKLTFSAEPTSLTASQIVIITIGTPVDEYHNSVRKVVPECVGELLPYLTSCETLVLRSTVSPGTTQHLTDWLAKKGIKIAVAFCPERVIQGKAMKEIRTMPQIISATSPRGLEQAEQVFSQIASKVVIMKPMEAEFAKLICNSYRYIQFAMTNQMYMVVHSAGCDYDAVLAGLKMDYPRMRDFPGPGFAAGPCLYKDTIQLSAFADTHFALGDAAIYVNEGLPAYLVRQLKQTHDLTQTTVGLLGMAFKADNDDPRSSLSYKLKKLLRYEAREVLTTDPYVLGDSDLLPLPEVIKRSDLLVVCTPHSVYRQLDLAGKTVLDIWNCVPHTATKVL